MLASDASSFDRFEVISKLGTYVPKNISEIALWMNTVIFDSMDKFRSRRGWWRDLKKDMKGLPWKIPQI